MWGDLPAELKVKILRYLPFTSLMRFMLLSKESFSLAEKLRRVGDIEIAGQMIPRLKGEALQVPLDNSMRLKITCRVSGQREVYEFKFVPDNVGGCFVQRYGVQDMHYDQDYESTAIQTLFRFSQFLDVHTLEIEQRTLTPGIAHALEKLSSSTLQAKCFRLRTCDSVIISKLLPCLPPHTSSIELTNAAPNTDFFDHEVIRTVQDFLLVFKEVELFDGQLGRLQAASLDLYTPNITSSSINELITVATEYVMKSGHCLRRLLVCQWLKGERAIYYIKLSGIDQVLQYDDLLEGVDPAIIEDRGFNHVLHSKYGKLGVLINDDRDHYYLCNDDRDHYCCCLELL